MKKLRSIGVITTSRADYGHLYWPLKALRERGDLKLHLIVLGAHLSPEFGETVQEIERDGFPIAARIECLLSSDSDTGMAKTIGLATLSLADTLSDIRPDLLLLIADRYEMLAPASVALALRIPIAHIEGGEVSEGAIDDAVRHGLTKLSHIHFTPTQQARNRVIAMGEEPWRVHQVGAPSLDHLRHRQLESVTRLENHLKLDFEKPIIVVSYHPLTLSTDTLVEAEPVFEALDQLDHQIVFCYPNADAGSRAIIGRATAFCKTRPNRHLFVNLNHLRYWSLLNQAELCVGNSSSGIMETPSLALPTVNIGKRQQGRERAKNIVDCPADASAISKAIKKALSPAFKKTLEGMTNPYGDGNAGTRIARILSEVTLGDELMMKKARPLDQWNNPDPS